MDILTLFRTYPSLTLNEIIDLTGTPKTSAYRMVSALTEMGFLEKDQNGKYTLGLVFLEFGQLVKDRLDLRNIAVPIMEHLRDDLKEAVHLAVRDQNEAIYIDKLDTDQPVRLFTKVGRRSPLYAGACSRVLLSYAEDRETYIDETPLTPISSGTITDKRQLLDRCLQTRREGFTISHSELEENTTSVAAPVYDASGAVIAAISIAGPDIRFGEERLERLTEKVKEGAFQISEKLGWKRSS